MGSSGLSPQTIVIPAGVNPNQGPITCDTPIRTVHTKQINTKIGTILFEGGNLFGGDHISLMGTIDGAVRDAVIHGGNCLQRP